MIYMSDYYVMTDCALLRDQIIWIFKCHIGDILNELFWKSLFTGIGLTEKLDFWRMKLFAGLVATVSSFGTMIEWIPCWKIGFSLRHCRMKSLLHSNVDQVPFINMVRVMVTAMVLLNGTKLLLLKMAGLDVSQINHSLVTEPRSNVKWKLILSLPTMVLSDMFSVWIVFPIIMLGVCQEQSWK